VLKKKAMYQTPSTIAALAMPTKEIPSQRSSLEQQRSRIDTSDSVIKTPSRAVTDPTHNDKTTMSPKGGHQKLVFSDPVAFRYLEEDPATIVLERRRRLEGFEIYVVEQWACSRVHPTFIIATYTGDTSHSIIVGVLSVPVDESTWSKRLQVYFKAVSQFHARRMETPLGILMVTNLSGFPSALTVIYVPTGDVRRHREDFIVNENLKRLGCSGRAAMNLQAPPASTIQKFHQLYRTSETVPLYASVMELVKLCQTALVIYGKLLPAYADGLLCDITEKAITDWWSDIGTFFFNIEPSDGILGPTTVAALLGLLMGAYNRLKSSGAPVGKDGTDIPHMKRALAQFQRAQKLEKTRRLDRLTLDRLHLTTAKIARNEGWAVPKAVKSTVAEISGKGGEMVMGIVGARDKAGIAEVETLDLDRMAQLVTGAKMKWLWQGKAIKSGFDPFGRPSDELNGRVFSTDDAGNYMWTSDKRDSLYGTDMARHMNVAYNEKEQNERSGFHRLRDAVAGRSHHPRHSKDGGEVVEASAHKEPQAEPVRVSEEKPLAEEKLRPDHVLRPYLSHTPAPAPFTPVSTNEAPKRPTQALRRTTSEKTARQSQAGSSIALTDSVGWREKRPRPAERRTDIETIRNELKSGVYQDFSSAFEYQGAESRVLRRSRSAVKLQPTLVPNPRSNRVPRHLSFSMVEDAVLAHRNYSEDEATNVDAIAPFTVAAIGTASILAQQKAQWILRMQLQMMRFVESLVANVESLDSSTRDHLEEINTTYYQRLEDYQGLRATSTELVAEEKAVLTESLRRIEMLGAKLDYELSALQSRVQEVEDGIVEFERNVVDVEERARGIVGHDSSFSNSRFDGWGGWLLHLGGFV
jgi:hypothetical protein